MDDIEQVSLRSRQLLPHLATRIPGGKPSHTRLVVLKGNVFFFLLFRILFIKVENLLWGGSPPPINTHAQSQSSAVPNSSGLLGSLPLHRTVRQQWKPLAIAVNQILCQCRKKKGCWINHNIHICTRHPQAWEEQSPPLDFHITRFTQ